MISKRVYVFGLFLAALASAQTLPSTLTSLPAADTQEVVAPPSISDLSLTHSIKTVFS